MAEHLFGAKLKVTDDSKPLDTTIKRLTSLEKVLKSVNTFGKALQNPFKQATKDIDNMSKKLSEASTKSKKQNQDWQKATEKQKAGPSRRGAGVQTAGDTAATMIGAVGHEDVAAAQKVTQFGDFLKEKFRGKSPFSSGSNKGTAGEEEGGAGGGLGAIGAVVGKLGTVGLVAGIAASVAGKLYSAASSRAEAFRSTGETQLGFLQTIGTSRERSAIAGGLSGFYEGGGSGAENWTGTQRLSYAAAIAKQTGRSLEDIEIKDKGIMSPSKTAVAYGMSPEQLGGYQGTMNRFGSGKYGIAPDMMGAVGMAGRSGMGGARLTEFLDNLHEGITTAVNLGTKEGWTSQLSTLGALTKGDEVLKAMAPQLAASIRQVGAGAASLSGGTESSWMLQSLMSNGHSLKDARSIAANEPLEAAKSVIGSMNEVFGGDLDQRDLAVQKALGWKIADPDLLRQAVGLVQQGGTQDDLNKLISEGTAATEKRYGVTGGITTEVTTKAVNDEMNKLTESTRKLNSVVTDVSAGMQGMVNGITGLIPGIKNQWAPNTSTTTKPAQGQRP